MGKIATAAQEAAEHLRKKTELRPTVGVVLGSGLGAFAEELRSPNVVPYSEIPHFPRSTVAGHAGRLVVGTFESVPLVVMAGRVHAYEGYTAQDVAFPPRVLAFFGVKSLVITNAAGAINTAFRPGDLMVITDHLNLTGMNPLTGGEEKELGSRFPDMSQAYHPKLRDLCERAARGIGLTLRRGVYAGLLGSSYETPAEIRMLRTLGADAVGMSTVLEVIAANQLGVKVLGLSCMTNMAAGVLAGRLDHREVMKIGERSQGVFLELLHVLLPALAKLD